ncbi:hypothetical protein [Burkholderia ambifaria]|nr:hypothetical protein [Burkholderia ambifaria]
MLFKKMIVPLLAVGFILSTQSAWAEDCPDGSVLISVNGNQLVCVAL